MAFNIQNLDNVTSGAGNAPRMWSYRSADLLATIEADGYFNDASEDFGQYDLLYIVSTVSAAVQQRTISSARFATTVTTAAYVYDGKIQTDEIDALAVTDAKVALAIPKTVTVSLSAAQVNALFTTSIALVAAPGANLMHVCHGMILEVDWVSAQYAAGGVIAAQYDSTAAGLGTLASGTVAAATLNGYTADSTIGVRGLLTTSASTTTVNKGLYIGVQTADFTTGDSPVKVHLTYSTVSTSV